MVFSGFAAAFYVQQRRKAQRREEEEKKRKEAEKPSKPAPVPEYGMVKKTF